jgi:hypothetical protein
MFSRLCPRTTELIKATQKADDCETAFKAGHAVGYRKAQRELAPPRDSSGRFAAKRRPQSASTPAEASTGA